MAARLMRILVVEDDTLTNRMLCRLLESWGHEVTGVGDGEEALERLQRDEAILLMVTDWMMPRMDGPTLCRRARALDRRRYLHIIMLTARGATDELLLEAIEAGADAFLAKPLNPLELQAQLRVMGRIIEQQEQLSHLIDRLNRTQARMRANLEAAARIQRSLLPEQPPELPGCEVSWIFDSCDEVAGDMFNVVPLDADHVGLYVLDVSGHGVPAALLAASVHRALSPYPEQGGLLLRKGRIASPVEVAEALNRRFPVMDQSGQFFSFQYGVLELPRRRLRFISAGHPPPVVASASGAQVCPVGRSRVVGVWPELDCVEHRIDLAPGDLLLFYTDGVFEALNASREEFGLERLIEVAAQNRCRGVRAAVEDLRRRVREFSGSGPRRDDITILGVGLRP